MHMKTDDRNGGARDAPEAVAEQTAPVNIQIFVSHRIDLNAELIDNPLYVPVRCGAVYDRREKVSILGDDTGDNISEKRLSFCEFTVLGLEKRGCRLLRAVPLPAVPVVCQTAVQPGERAQHDRSASADPVGRGQIRAAGRGGDATGDCAV